MEVIGHKIILTFNDDTETKYKNITIHTPNDNKMDQFLNKFEKLLKEYKFNTKELDNIEYSYVKQSKDLLKDCDWYEMPEYKINPKMLEAPSIIMIYIQDDEEAQDFIDDFNIDFNVNITPSTTWIWYPKRPDDLSPDIDKMWITEKPVLPKYPIYIISKGRWEKRYTSKYFEWAGIPYKIVVEPQEYEKYAEVIDPKKILILPKKYLNKNQGGIPARNFVWEHSTKSGAKRHWIVDDNIRSYKRLNNSERVMVKSGASFRVVEDYVDRYTNIKMAGHNYSMFAPASNTILRPITFNTRIYSSILLSNDIKDRWRGRYNEDTDLSLRLLKKGYPTVLFNSMLADKLATLSQKGENTDTIYNVKDALYLKAKSLQDQHPDVVEITTRFGRTHHMVNYRPFKHLKPIFKKGIVLSDKTNNYGMKLVKKDSLQKRGGARGGRYKIIEFPDGYRVMGVDHGDLLSKKPLSYKQARKQLIAVSLREGLF